MKKIFITIFLTLAFSKIMYAQDDYIIKLNGDTIKGKIREQALLGKEIIKIRATGEKSFVKIDNSEIKEYYKEKIKSTFTRKALPNTTDTVYLKIWEKGKVDFFSYYRSSGQFTHVDYYVSKGNSPLLSVKTNGVFTSSRNERQQSLFDLISDRPDLIESFKSINDYSFQSIQKLIKAYNDSFK
jgi:hypothetical protein